MEGLQVAVVDAEKRRGQPERARQFGLVMHLDEAVHAERRGRGDEIGRERVIDARHDHQDAIRAHRAGLEHLVGVDQEILADNGQGGGCPCRHEILRRSLEILLIREDGKAGRAALSVSARERWRVEIGANQAFGGARLLDFGNQREKASIKLGFQRSQKPARPGGCLSLGAQSCQGKACLGRSNLFALCGLDGAENVAHATLTRSKPRSRGRAGRRPCRNRSPRRPSRHRPSGSRPCPPPPEHPPR